MPTSSSSVSTAGTPSSPDRKGSRRPYVASEIDGAQVLLHRFLMAPPRGMDVDHRDGNGFNNQRSNLRVATRSQNLANQKTRSKSGFKGVYFHPRSRRWRASISLGQNKTRRLGDFKSPEPAAHAYDAAARERFGEFARLNFPRDGESQA